MRVGPEAKLATAKDEKARGKNADDRRLRVVGNKLENVSAPGLGRPRYRPYRTRWLQLRVNRKACETVGHLFDELIRPTFQMV